MLRHPPTFLILAAIAGFVGFGSFAGLVANIAQVLFFVFLGFFLLSFVLNGNARRD